MNRAVSRAVLGRRFLRYQVTKNHFDAQHTRNHMLQKGMKILYSAFSEKEL